MKVWLIVLSIGVLFACQNTPIAVKPIPAMEQQGEPMITDPIPIIMVNPRYPTSAARIGQNGWVHLKFDLNDEGLVKNVRIVDASPAGFGFEKKAKQALEKWRYKTNLAVTDLTITLEFRIPD